MSTSAPAATSLRIILFAAMQPSHQRTLSDERRLNAVPTQNALNRIFRGVVPTDDAVNGRRPASNAGIVLPNSLLSNFLPKDLIDMIVQRVGARDLPADLIEEAKKYWIFPQGKSLKYRNAATNESIDFNPVRQEWWDNFLSKLTEFESDESGDKVKLDGTSWSARLHWPRTDDVEHNEWLATMDSDEALYENSHRSDFIMLHSISGYDEFLPTQQMNRTNGLKIDFLIEHKEHSCNDMLACVQHPAILDTVAAIPFCAISTPAQFSVVYSKEPGYSRVSLLLYSPQFLIECAQPREPLFDATAWMRNYIQLPRHFGRPNFNQYLTKSRITFSAGLLFASSSASANSLQSQHRKDAWLDLIKGLLALKLAFDTNFEIEAIRLNPNCHQIRRNQTSANLRMTMRDIFENDSRKLFDYQKLILSMQLEELDKLVDDELMQNLDDRDEDDKIPTRDAIMIRFTVPDHRTPRTLQEALECRQVAGFFWKFESILDLPNENMSLMASRWYDPETFVDLVLYSPDFVRDCAQAASTRSQRLGATKALKAALAAKAAAQQQ